MKKLLLIDDDAAFRELLHMALQVSGFEVHALEHGEAALRHLRETGSPAAYDLVIADFLMPIMDGLRFLHSLRKEFAGTMPPVIMLTAIRRADLMGELSAAGASAVISKPIELNDLITTIRTMTDAARA